MKKLTSIFFLILGIAALCASCTPTKQSCAAYNQVEAPAEAE